MNKSELYYNAIDLYKKTGQGIILIPYSNINDTVDELVRDGLMKIVNIKFNTLPDDKFACLTNVYCVEEDKDPTALTYMRIYVGIDKVVDLGKVEVTLLDAIKNPEIMTGYSKWLNKNHKQLIKINDLDNVIVPLTKLSKEEIDYLESRSWYKDSLTASEALYELTEGDDNVQKKLSITRELIRLMRKDKKYISKIKEYEENIKEYESEVILRKSVKSFLSNYSDEKIKNII